MLVGTDDDDVINFFRAEAHGASSDESNVAVSALAWLLLLIRPLVFFFFLVSVCCEDSWTSQLFGKVPKK